MTMHLEVITRTPKGGARPTPLLFVHGAYGGAWLWNEHFLPYFAERGWVAHALSLRGHAGSDGIESVQFARLGDYVADVEQVAASLPTRPVLIGHSLGGMVVQHCLHRSPAPAAVLMASSPPHGMIGSLFGMALSNPQLMYELGFAHHLGPGLTDGRAIERALFSPGLPEALVRSYMRRFQAESDLVILDLLFLDLPPSTPMLDTPVLVLGAEDDSFVTRGGLETTADTYRTRAEIFPGMAHQMMLDLGWENVAARIHAWLKQNLDSREPMHRPLALIPPRVSFVAWMKLSASRQFATNLFSDYAEAHTLFFIATPGFKPGGSNPPSGSGPNEHRVDNPGAGSPRRSAPRDDDGE